MAAPARSSVLQMTAPVLTPAPVTIATSPASTPATPSPALVQGLDANQPAVVVHVPDRDRIGRIVDPSLAIDAVGLRQHVFGEQFGLLVEAQIAAAVHLACPDIAVLVDLRRVH